MRDMIQPLQVKVLGGVQTVVWATNSSILHVEFIYMHRNPICPLQWFAEHMKSSTGNYGSTSTYMSTNAFWLRRTPTANIGNCCETRTCHHTQSGLTTTFLTMSCLFLVKLVTHDTWHVGKTRGKQLRRVSSVWRWVSGCLEKVLAKWLRAFEGRTFLFCASHWKIDLSFSKESSSFTNHWLWWNQLDRLTG